jgi:enterochelin esterase-like enzyme
MSDFAGADLFDQHFLFDHKTENCQSLNSFGSLYPDTALRLMEETQKILAPENEAAPGFIRAESVTGDLRIHAFSSRVFRNTRFLRVWLPPAYDEPANADRHYPALYLNDGQNLFETSTSFTHVEWQVDETADRLIREDVIPPMIIVGVDNAAKDRLRE